MSDTPLLARSHHKFVAFSAVGVAMVCVPLMQVLQVQQADLQQLQSNRALLDPVAAAVHTQYGLLAHQGLASQVLLGVAEQEQPRAAAAQEVATRLGTLTTVLTDGGWAFALAEARTLGDDWRSLVQQVVAQHISAAQSDDAHRVRVEQTLQVVDLVTLSQAPADRPAQANQQAWLASIRLLSRLASDIAQAKSASNATFDPAVATPLSALPQADVDQALAQAQSRAAELVAVLPQPGAETAQLSAVTSLATARQAALKAHQHLFHALHQAQDQALLAQTAAVQQQRQWLLSALAALAALATALGMSLWRALRSERLGAAAQDGDDEHDDASLHAAGHGEPGAASASTPTSKHRDETGRLLQRLRENAVSPAPHRAPRLDQEDSLPPPR